MWGTDPIKSKWECLINSNISYVLFLVAERERLKIKRFGLQFFIVNSSVKKNRL